MSISGNGTTEVFYHGRLWHMQKTKDGIQFIEDIRDKILKHTKATLATQTKVNRVTTIITINCVSMLRTPHIVLVANSVQLSSKVFTMRFVELLVSPMSSNEQEF